ncbi:MAG TPA: D-aminoacylase [Oleiagrimonas sp.]|nr:D-aminoacylase [Oleiagrimonas sp.]
MVGGPSFDILVRQAEVVDGTGARTYAADVGIRDGRIAAIGSLAHATAASVIDGRDRCLSPGFIDVHTHDDTHVIRAPEMAPKLSQGVTTVVVGNCGISAAPVRLPSDEVPDPMNLLGRRDAFRYPRFADYARAVERARPSVNVAALVGHTALRANHMSRFDRPADASEIESMRRDLAAALDQGAIGMSSGLAYKNARHAPQQEMDALVGELGRRDAIYTTHLRDEFAGLPEAMREAFDTARRAGARLVISHLKCAGVANWGNAAQALARLDAAAEHQTCHCDCYPYTAGSSTLDPGQVSDDIDIFITWSDACPEVTPAPLRTIAEQWGVSLLDAAQRLLPAGAVYHNMSEADMRQVLAHPRSMVGSDGLPNDPFPHPRLWGTFPRVLGHYCREQKLLTLPETVRKMTSLAATNFGLADRGVIREGAFADLVLFDFDQIRDAATFAEPTRPSRGIDTVIVNGHVAWRDGAVAARAGQLLKNHSQTDSGSGVRG